MIRKLVLNNYWLFPVILLAAAFIYQDSVTPLTGAENLAYPPPGGGESSKTLPSPTPNPTQIPISSKPEISDAAQSAVNYIVSQKDISEETISVLDDYTIEYPLLDQMFQVVTLLNTQKEQQIYKLMINLSDGRIEEDLSKLSSSLAADYINLYGKMEPALYNRLQDIKDTDVLLVAIWSANEQEISKDDPYAPIFQKFPEAKDAYLNSGKLWDVSDPELANQIKDEYHQLKLIETTQRLSPLVNHLSEKNIDVRSYGTLPSISARLTKLQILELSQRDDVGMIYLIEERGKEETDIAIPTDLIPVVWDRGFDGTGVKIAFINSGNIDPDVGCLTISDSRNSPQGFTNHSTLVASVGACDHATYRGAAFGASVLDAGFDSTGWPGVASQEDAVAALQWAVESPRYAPIINLSHGWEEDNNLHWLDRAFDYWARREFVLIVKSAGNTGGSITSPGKGWNVFTIGGTNDDNTVEWGDDTMYSPSSYINPSSINGDREKPEVVAPAENITAIDAWGLPTETDGTSLAAPQVAGLAALLIDRNASLTSWPEALRAIIMASATNNIEGPSIIVRYQGDLKDGAGAINADLADQIAQLRGTPTGTCYSSCWWGDSITSTNPPIGSDLERKFYAKKGDLIRVAISWWSHADTPGNNYSFDQLDTDLDLRIKSPDGQYIPGVISWSYDNNYEMVEFSADETGVYTIAVRNFRLDETLNNVGIAFVLLPYQVYLPLIVK